MGGESNAENENLESRSNTRNMEESLLINSQWLEKKRNESSNTTVAVEEDSETQIDSNGDSMVSTTGSGIVTNLNSSTGSLSSSDINIVPISKGGAKRDQCCPSETYYSNANNTESLTTQTAVLTTTSGTATTASEKALRRLLAPQRIVEVHGSLRSPNSLVLYGDLLPRKFSESLEKDFDENIKHGNHPDHTSNSNSSTSNETDLIIVMGTSLQVAPICALPNLANSKCTRLLINSPLDDCLKNTWSKVKGNQSVSKAEKKISTAAVVGSGSSKSSKDSHTAASAISLCGRSVTLRPLWKDRKKYPNQLLVDSSCDSFVQRFFNWCDQNP